jgi:acetyltransferase-like isoleucine patch superfamily enzyme
MSRIGFGAKLPQPRLIEIGDSVSIGEQAWLNTKDDCGDGRTTLRIGRGAYIGRFVQINAWQDVVIEDDVLIADRVFISDADHNYEDLETPIRHQGDRFKGGVLIGTGAWVGIGAVILPGVRLGKHSIVAANAVVTKSVPDFAIAGGVPARIIKFQEGISDEP